MNNAPGVQRDGGPESGSESVVEQPNGPIVLEATEVTKRFGGLVAVNSVDYAISERSINSLIGPNGAGKTTFFNMIAGLYRPTEGRITFRGRSIISLHPNQITTPGI